MQDLITALQIFLKYGNPHYPTHCEHDVLHIHIDPDIVSEHDIAKLEKLSFTPDDFDGFSSFRFGSC